MGPRGQFCSCLVSSLSSDVLAHRDQIPSEDDLHDETRRLGGLSSGSRGGGAHSSKQSWEHVEVSTFSLPRFSAGPSNPQAIGHAESAQSPPCVIVRHQRKEGCISACNCTLHNNTATMSEDKDTLIAMGFAPERADWALRVKKGQGVQAAMDFLLAHADDPIPDPEDEMEEDSE